MLTFSRSFILINKYLCNLYEQPLNAFEQQREAQIAKNHRKMEELGLRVGPKPVSPKVKSQAQRVDTVKISNIPLNQGS
jgi:hypothetical protein